MTALLRTDADVLEAWRTRIRELGITHQTVDAIAGWADGWCSKIMCGMKNAGPKTRETMNAALGIAFVVAVDEEAKARVERRWVQRERPLKKLPLLTLQNEVPLIVGVSASLVSAKREDKPANSKQHKGFARMQILGRAGGMASGKTRRKKAMRRRQLQRKRSHAARMRWAKRA